MHVDLPVSKMDSCRAPPPPVPMLPFPQICLQPLKKNKSSQGLGLGEKLLYMSTRKRGRERGKEHRLTAWRVVAGEKLLARRSGTGGALCARAAHSVPALEGVDGGGGSGGGGRWRKWRRGRRRSGGGGGGGSGRRRKGKESGRRARGERGIVAVGTRDRGNDFLFLGSECAVDRVGILRNPSFQFREQPNKMTLEINSNSSQFHPNKQALNEIKYRNE